MIYWLGQKFMKNEVLGFSVKFYGFIVVFCADSEYIFCFMIQVHFCGENHKICVKYQGMTHYRI
jgi:hypothetical protein